MSKYMDISTMTDNELITEYKTAMNLRSLRRGLVHDPNMERHLQKRIEASYDEISNRGIWGKVGNVKF